MQVPKPSPLATQPRTLTPAQVARIFRVPTWTLHCPGAAVLLRPARLPGRPRRYSRAAIAALIEDRTHRSPYALGLLTVTEAAGDLLTDLAADLAARCSS